LNRRHGLLRALGWAASVGSLPALTLAQVLPKPVGELRALGQDRYQVGRIVVDKRARSFVVPGRVHALGKPLEYLATSPGGMKAYESLFELDTTGTEFNLACILIGIERDPKQVPWQQFGQASLVGQRVSIQVAWSADGKRQQVPAAQALLNADADVKPESVEWVYTGSPASEALGRFAADDTGTLIGFIHDANSIIESVATIGIGAYGSIRGHAMLPPVGSAVELIIAAGNAVR
jgi:hypothetical protein